MSSPIIVDATGKSLGRLASVVAYRLRGKDQKQWTPSALPTVKITVINLSKLAISPKKLRQSVRKRTSGYPGNVKSVTLEQRFRGDPCKLFADTVRNMLPANTHRKKLLLNLHLKNND